MTARALEAGGQLDRYRVVAELGRGAFSEVFLVEDTDGRRLVLKVPHEALMGDVNAFDRFRREVEITSRLEHPGIQRAFDDGAPRTRPYLVMEYIDGESLRAVLARTGRLPLDRAIRFAVQLADAMAYAHAKGVYHRDLKPENVLVTPDDRVVVTDFGIALLVGARRLTWRWLTSTVGTPDYMAPEQIQGQRGDARTDVYAMGVMMYEMLAGRVPWEGDNALAVMSQHLSAPLPPLHELNPEVPAPIEAIIRRCLRKRSEERYPDAGVLLHDLEHWQDLDLRGFAFPDELPIRPETRRGLWLLIAGISLGFVAASAAFVTLWYLVSHHVI